MTVSPPSSQAPVVVIETHEDTKGHTWSQSDTPPSTSFVSKGQGNHEMPTSISTPSVQKPQASCETTPSIALGIQPTSDEFQPEHSAASSLANSPSTIVGQDLHVDNETLEYDSAIGDDERASITTSLNSTVTDFRYSHGRRYHAFEEDAYYLPNDEKETERLDIQHHVWALTLKQHLHIAPLPTEIHNVIDIGTGTGGWAIEFADQYPDAQVIGTDLSPIQPTWIPPNCTFICDNAEDEWLYDRKFDFVHSRMLLMGMHDWPRYFKQPWNNLNPGGWIEVLEVQFPIAFADDGSVPPDSPLLVWSRRCYEAAAKAGIHSMVTTKFRDMIERQGYVDIREKWPKWALGPWPKGDREKEIGNWTLENTKQFVSAVALSLWTKHLGWSAEAVELFLIDVRKDLDDRKKHYYWQMAIFAAQKPLERDGPVEQ